MKLAPDTIGPDEIKAVEDVLMSGRVSMGPRVEEFEQRFAEHVGSRYAVMVNSGSSANLLAVLVADLPKGSEVIVPALTWSTTVWPVIQVGCVPVFVDCDPDTLQMDMEEVWGAINGNTSAIIPAHIMGNAVDITQLLAKHFSWNVKIIEDACEAQGTSYDGTKVGTWGHVGTFSFFISHHMTTVEGGMIVTNSAKTADKLRSMRSHGWARGLKDEAKLAENHPDIDPRFLFVNEGYNLRPDEMKAAIGLVQLEKVEAWNERRRVVFESMWKALLPLQDRLRVMQPTENCEMSPFAFPVVVLKGSRQDFAQHLDTHKIDTRPIVAGNLARHPAFEYQNCRIHGDLENADEVMKQGLYWGCHQDVTDQDIEKLIEAVYGYFRQAKVA